MVFKVTDLSSLILIKLISSLIYLIANFITHKIKFSVTYANILRFFICTLDFAILLILLSGYILEWCVMAYGSYMVPLSIFLCAASWLALATKSRVQFVFIICVLTLIVLLVIHFQFISMNYVYRQMPALYIFNAAYIGCWLIFDRYPKTITSFMERIGEKLSWVDALLGEIPHNDLALRNVCSFNLGLLNFTYIHTSGTTLNKAALILICLGLICNILIGLRLIKASASVKLYHGFTVQIIQHGYNNIFIIYNQLINKQLPKASWYAWAIALTMGLTFISPCYAMESTGGEVIIDASLTGEQQRSAPTHTAVDSAVGEGATLQRSAAHAQRQAHAAYEAASNTEAGKFTRDVFVAGAATSVVAGADHAYRAMTDTSPEIGGAAPNTDPAQAQIAVLEAKISEKDTTIATLSKTIEVQAKTIAELQQKSTWFACFKSCWKSSKKE